MPDDKRKRGKQDRLRVSASEPHEVSYLARKTEMPAPLVRKAIKEKGPMRANVERYLNQLKKKARG